MAGKAGQAAASAALLLCSLALAISASEWLFRRQQWAAFDAAVAQWQHPLYRMLPRSPLEFALVPGSEGTGVVRASGIEWHYRINSRGFRSTDYSAEAMAARRNVLLLGDSYLFGFAIDQQDTLSEAIKTAMTSAGAEVPNLHNLGVPGYNTGHEAAMLREQLAQQRPDLVVLTFVPNDAEPQGNVLRRPDVLYRHQPLWLLVQLKRAANHYLFGDREVLATGLNEMSTDFNEAYRLRNHKYQDTRRAFADIVALCRTHDVPLLVAVFPAFAASFDASYPYAPIHREVMQWSADSGVRALDLFDTFRGLPAQQYAVPGDGHPNAAANRLAAAAIAPVLQQMLGATRAGY